MLECVPAPARPRLDGRLDDPVWQVARPVELHSLQGDDAGWPASVMLAYDKQFLYLAIRCRQAPGVRYEPASGPRTRDADLSGHDRVELYLDLDRNFVTYDRLAIDHRGFTGDDCWGDATWNPNWFVACLVGRRFLDRRGRDPLGPARRRAAQAQQRLGDRHPADRARRRLPILEPPRRHRRDARRLRVSALPMSWSRSRRVGQGRLRGRRPTRIWRNWWAVAHASLSHPTACFDDGWAGIAHASLSHPTAYPIPVGVRTHGPYCCIWTVRVIRTRSASEWAAIS